MQYTAHRILESPESEGIDKDHQGHELDLCRKSQNPTVCLGALSKCSLSSLSGSLRAMTTALTVSWASLEPCIESGSGVFHGALCPGSLRQLWAGWVEVLWVLRCLWTAVCWFLSLSCCSRPVSLQGAWRPSLNISTLLTSIQLLMAEPNPDDPLMADIVRELLSLSPGHGHRWGGNKGLDLGSTSTSLTLD